MTPNQRAHALIAPVALTVAGLAAADWYLDPARGPFWLMSMAMMAIAWLVAGVAAWRARLSNKTPAPLRFLVLSVDLAGVMLAGALAVALMRRLGFDGGGLSHRAFGLACGLLLIFLGNATPKVIGPITGRVCSPAKAQAMQRFAGWTFVLAGLFYVAAWLVLPVAVAEPLSTAACALAVVLVGGRLTFLILSRRTSTPPV